MNKIAFRKNKDTLLITGNGVIAFGSWSIIRLILYMIVNRHLITMIIEQSVTFSRDDLPMDRAFFERLVFILLLVVLFIISLILLLLHFYVGLSARAEALKKKNGHFYLFLSILMIAGTVFSVLYSLSMLITAFGGEWALFGAGESLKMATAFSAESNPVWDAITSAVVDTTLLFTLMQMIISAFRVKRYRKRSGGQE